MPHRAVKGSALERLYRSSCIGRVHCWRASFGGREFVSRRISRVICSCICNPYIAGSGQACHGLESFSSANHILYSLPWVRLVISFLFTIGASFPLHQSRVSRYNSRFTEPPHGFTSDVSRKPIQRVNFHKANIQTAH